MMAIFDLLIALFVIWGIFSIRSYLKKLISQREEVKKGNSIYEVSSDDVLFFSGMTTKRFDEIAQGISEKIGCMVINIPPDSEVVGILKSTSESDIDTELKPGDKNIQEALDTIKKK